MQGLNHMVPRLESKLRKTMINHEKECVDCEYAHITPDYEICRNKEATRDQVFPIRCDIARDDDSMCGPDGKHWKLVDLYENTLYWQRKKLREAFLNLGRVIKKQFKSLFTRKNR